jgi:hypothetical protein
MTGTQLLASAAALIHEANPSDYDGFALSFINILLAETYDVNNRLRVAAGSAVLTVIPQLTALTETLTYENKLVMMALPYGLAEKLIVDDRDSSLWNMLHSKYINHLMEMDVGFVEAVPFSIEIVEVDGVDTTVTAPIFGFAPITLAENV